MLTARYEQMLTGAGTGIDRDFGQVLWRQYVTAEIAVDRGRSIPIRMMLSYCGDWRYGRGEKKVPGSIPVPAGCDRDFKEKCTPNWVRNRHGLVQKRHWMDGDLCGLEPQ